MHTAIVTNPHTRIVTPFENTVNANVVHTSDAVRLELLAEELLERSRLMESTGMLIGDRLVCIPIREHGDGSLNTMMLEADMGDVIDHRLVTCNIYHSSGSWTTREVGVEDYHLIVHRSGTETKIILLENIKPSSKEDFYSLFNAEGQCCIYLETDASAKEKILDSKFTYSDQ